MIRRLSTSSSGFASAFASFLGETRDAGEDVGETVRHILQAVRQRGDAALLEYTARFDRVELAAKDLRVHPDEIAAARASVPEATFAALMLAAERIRAHHERQKPGDDRYTDETGAELGHRWTPIAAAGLYVPGGTASYPSSVLMNAIPARIAGVPRLVMTVPAPDGRLNPLVLAAASIAGIDEVYRIGGAQAVAALAFGTESIAAVDKITGPGNAYVAEAKRQVFGRVGIDMIAGPSEILVIADRGNDPSWVAADLLSQAEHDEAAQAILITDDPPFAERVIRALKAELEMLPRAAIARESLERHGAIILVRDFEEALPLIDAIAAEHVELLIRDPEPLAARIQHAGAIFLGRYSSEVIGDYVAGTNHVLPTSRSARFASGLSVVDFMKRTSLVKLSVDAYRALAPAALKLAEAEGLGAHARAAAIRTNEG